MTVSRATDFPVIARADRRGDKGRNISKEFRKADRLVGGAWDT